MSWSWDLDRPRQRLSASRSRSARRRAYRRLLPAERLVGARSAGVGISAARAVPGQEFPDQHLALGGDARRLWRRSASRCRRGRKAIPSRSPISRWLDRQKGGLGDRARSYVVDRQMRDAGLAPHSCRAARRTRRCTGPRRRSSRTMHQRLQPPAGRPDRHRHACRPSDWRSARCSKSAMAASNPCNSPTASGGRSSTTAMRLCSRPGARVTPVSALVLASASGASWAPPARHAVPSAV